MPCEMASTSRKLIGMNKPRKKIKEAMAITLPTSESLAQVNGLQEVGNMVLGHVRLAHILCALRILTIEPHISKGFHEDVKLEFTRLRWQSRFDRGESKSQHGKNNECKSTPMKSAAGTDV